MQRISSSARYAPGVNLNDSNSDQVMYIYVRCRSGPNVHIYLKILFVLVAKVEHHYLNLCLFNKSLCLSLPQNRKDEGKKLFWQAAVLLKP